MALTPQNISDFSKVNFWDNFFKKRQEAFEWYGEYPELCSLLHKYIKPKDKILVIGCGNSQLSSDLYDAGNLDITNIDISDIVIEQMVKKNSEERPQMKFLKMDALQMSFQENEFSVVLDKGTLDALLPNGTEEHLATAEQLFNQISQVLKVGGRYLCISLAQDFILKKVLDYFSIQGWIIRIHRVSGISQSENSFKLPVFMYVCTKFKKMDNCQTILELAFEEDHIQRVTSIEFIVNEVKSLQSFSIVQHWLNTGSHLRDHIGLELYNESSNLPRYRLHVVDIAKKSSNMFAIFIVPQGREVEWLFSSEEGRKQLAKMAGFSRLVVVSLSRDHIYTDMDSIKSELSSKVMELAPSGLNPRILVPFLSVGDNLGSRVVRDRGQSNLSGEYVIEDVDMEDGMVYRHLIFLNNPNVIQSEARLLKGKAVYKGHKEKVQRIDFSYLACQHHVAMVSGLAFIKDFEKIKTNGVSVLLVGLGGGGLPIYLHHWYNKVHLDVVEIDFAVVSLATKWFGFQEDERMKIHIADGIDYIKEKAAEEHNSKYDVVMFDVDSKDLTLGMSCPPQCFVEKELLSNVKTILDPKGVFIMNLVCRNTSLQEQVLSDLTHIFSSVYSKSIKEEVNEIVYALPESVSSDTLNGIPISIEKNIKNMNVTIKGKTKSRKDFIDIQEMMASLRINSFKEKAS